ncbi:MAG: ATP-binding protein, partial [Opitutales bacterium]
MEVNRQLWMTLGESSAIGALRREAEAYGMARGLNASLAERLRLVVSEAGSNILTHAGRGHLAVVPSFSGASLSVLAIDKGPGIGDLAKSSRDGFSSRANSAGLGLGSLRRLADDFEIFSTPQQGTVLRCRLDLSEPRPARLQVEGLNRPCRHETVSGDQMRIRWHRGDWWLLLADGLGHGQKAHDASMAAAEVFESEPFESPQECIERIHVALRSTRGAAAGVARVSEDPARVQFCGVGNVEAYFLGFRGRASSLVSKNGTLGHAIRALETVEVDWPPGSALIMNSDGISTRANLQGLRNVAAASLLVVAGVLMRDFGKAHDDCSVLVARRTP